MNLLKYGHKVKVIDLRPCRSVNRTLWARFRTYYYDEYGTWPSTDYNVDDVLAYFNERDVDVVDQLEVIRNG